MGSIVVFSETKGQGEKGEKTKGGVRGRAASVRGSYALITLGSKHRGSAEFLACLGLGRVAQVVS